MKIDIDEQGEKEPPLTADEVARLRAVAAKCEGSDIIGVAVSGSMVLALLDALDAAERERDQARADLRTYGMHILPEYDTPGCAKREPWAPPETQCTCGLAEALARAEGRG